MTISFHRYQKNQKIDDEHFFKVPGSIDQFLICRNNSTLTQSSIFEIVVVTFHFFLLALLASLLVKSGDSNQWITHKDRQICYMIDAHLSSEMFELCIFPNWGSITDTFASK